MLVCAWLQTMHKIYTVHHHKLMCATNTRFKTKQNVNIFVCSDKIWLAYVLEERHTHTECRQ